MDTRYRLHVLSLITLLAATAAPSTARACWDGYSGMYGDVAIMGPGERWELEIARALGTWLPRIDALLPEGASVISEFGYVEVCRDGSCTEHRWNDRNLAGLFQIVADTIGASPGERRAARAVETSGWTIQIAATTDPLDARRIAERFNLSDAGEHGYYEAGGFPALNDRAHVVEGRDGAGRTVHRVIVGTFISRTDADAQAAGLGAILGQPVLVRPL